MTISELTLILIDLCLQKLVEELKRNMGEVTRDLGMRLKIVLFSLRKHMEYLS